MKCFGFEAVLEEITWPLFLLAPRSAKQIVLKLQLSSTRPKVTVAARCLIWTFNLDIQLEPGLELQPTQCQLVQANYWDHASLGPAAVP